MVLDDTVINMNEKEIIEKIRHFDDDYLLNLLDNFGDRFNINYSDDVNGVRYHTAAGDVYLPYPKRLIVNELRKRKLNKIKLNKNGNT